MKDETKRQLDEAFAQHAQRVEQQRQAKVVRETKEEQFLKAFRERRDSTVKPAFERIREYLSSKGMETRIAQSEERVSDSGKQDAREEIKLTLLLGGEEYRYSGFDQPYLALQADKYKGNVNIWVSTIAPRRGGQSGSIGSVNLEQITEAFLEQKVTELVTKVL